MPGQHVICHARAHGLHVSGVSTHIGVLVVAVGNDECFPVAASQAENWK